MNIFSTCIAKLRFISSINLIATYRLNLYYFGLKGLIYLPIIALGGVTLRRLGGKIILNVPIQKGILYFGERYLGTNPNKLKSTWEVSGTITLGGKCKFGNGMKLCCEGNLHLGSNITFTGNSHIYCKKSIIIGNNSLISWDVLIMDNDSHDILDENNIIINAPKEISIGNDVWIGCRTLILKGAIIPSNVVVAADSTLTKSIEESYCIIGGKANNLRVLRRNITWKQ